jgi:SAM-dependent methyltransferase
MQPEELRRRIGAFPSWSYEFEFDNGVSTPVYDRELANRQRWRYAYLFERLLSVTGGSLRGRRVLDLGCNAGFWSLAAHEARADIVLGVDAREEFVEQASLVFEAKHVDPAAYRLQAADLFTQTFGEFDIVLCLGVIDQVDRPAELFELMAATGAALLLIDTDVSRSRSSLFETTRLYNKRVALGDGLVLLPSRQAVADLAERHGFATVALAPVAAGYSIMSSYRRERRCGFICHRASEVVDLPAEQRPHLVPWWLRDPAALVKA